MVGKVLTKQVTKFIPLGGQIVAASLGYIIMKKIAEAHVEESYKMAKIFSRKYKKLKNDFYNSILKTTG